MAKDFWEKWEYRAWLADSELGDCEPATRGIWTDWISHMMERESYFLRCDLEDLATKGRTTKANALAAIKDLFLTGTATIEFENVTQNVTQFVTALSRTYNGKITVTNRRREKKLKAKENNKLRQQRLRDNRKRNASVTVQSKSKSNDNSKIELSKSKTRATQPSNRFDAHDAKQLGFAVEQIFDAFPEIIITPAKAGMIASEVKDTKPHREAWNLTVSKYLANYDPAKNSYNPERVGTVLSVFRDELSRLENKNGKTINYRQQNDQQRIDERAVIEQTRTRVEERRAALSGRGSADR